MFREMRPSTMVLVTVLLLMLVVPMAFIDLVPKEGPGQTEDYPTAPPPPKRQPPPDEHPQSDHEPTPEEDSDPPENEAAQPKQSSD